ncbi:hypothetical protein PRIC2_011634 [Phytophthora ramorum]
MKLHPRGEPLLDETMELPTLSVTPGPPHPRGGRGSFSSSYSSGFAGTDSLCSFNSSQLFDDSDSQEVDVDDLDSSSSRGDYALLSMPVESAKRMVPTTGVVTRPSSRVMDASWNSQISSVRSTAAIADALRELREGRVAVEQVLAVEDEERRLEDNDTKVTSVSLNKLVTRLSTHRDLFVLSMGLLAATIHGGLWSLLARQVNAAIAAFVPYDRHDVDAAALALMLLSLALGVTAHDAATSENEADVVVAEVLSNLQTLLALNAQRRVREKHALRVRITERERIVQHGKKAALQAGKAVEQGTHVELLQRGNSFYRRLHLTQRTASSLCPSGAAPLRLQYQRRVVHAAPTSPTKLTERDVKALARPERTLLMVGFAASVLVGLAAPLLGVLISEMLADMVQQYTRFLASRDAQALVNTLRPLVMRHGFFLSAGAAVVVVFQSMQLFCLDAAAERVASQLRDLHFSSLLAQPVSFFDAPQHAPKLLVDALATQASTASLVVGRAQGYKLQIAVALVASLAVAFWRGSWMLTLVLLAALPLLLIGESIRAQYTLKTRSIPDRTESEEAVDVHVSEALRNRPTVVMLGLETSWCSSFDVLLQRPLRYTRHKAQLDAVARGFSGVVMVAACALTCWLSGVLVHSGDATFRELVRSLAIVLVSAQSLGLAVAWVSRTEVPAGYH